MISSIFNKVIYDITNYQGENILSSTLIIIFFAFVLITYWIVLLYMYEKEEDYTSVDYIDDEEIFKKYNPLIAGCIADNRGVLSRDIIAVLLNLSNKGIVRLEVAKDIKSEKENQYKYMLYRVREKEHIMDPTERQVHFMLFKYVYREDDGVDLIKRLQDIPNEKVMYKKFKELEKTAKKELNKIGANVNSVPKIIKSSNVLVMIITILLCIYHISQVAFNLEITLGGLLVVGIIVSFMLMSIPILVALGYLILKIIGHAKKGIKKINERNFYGKKIFSRSVEIILSIIIVMIATALLTHNEYFVIDMFVIGIAYLIVGTDGLMLKNNKEFLKDYESIKKLKEKLEDYTNLKQRNVEQIKLWKEYLAYSVAFGIPTEIVKYLDGLSVEDELLEELNNYDLLYTSLEVMWGFNSKKNNKYEIFNRYGIFNKYNRYGKYNEYEEKRKIEEYRKFREKFF